MKVPFLDLKMHTEPLSNELNEAMQKVIEKTAFAGGPFVTAFEEHFAEYCQCSYAVGVGSGTEALWAALIGLGVGPEDEVITVPNSFIATAEAITYCGARPVFVDIDEKLCTMDPLLLERAITSKTKAVIPVHLFGQPADMDPVIDIARKHGLVVIEDACQAHGAEYKGKRAGSLGDAGCFSFYPGKNLGAFGEAGAVVTNNQEYADRIKVFRDHGQSKKYYHDMVGWNARMDGLQAAVLEVKLKYLDEWNEARRKNACLYDNLFSGLDAIKTPREAEYAKHVYHLYPIRTESRDYMLSGLKEKDIFCGIHYPVPLHLTGAYSGLGYKKGDFPVAEKIADELLSLPLFPELTDTQIHYVADMVKVLVDSQ